MKRLYITAAICLLPFIILTAQDAGKLSLRDAITQALTENNSYKSNRSKVAESQAQLDEAWGALWPVLASDASYLKSGEESASGTKIDSQYLLNIVNCSISLNPGTVYNSIMAARDERIIAENNLRVTRGEIEKSTIKLFYNLILARETVRIQTESADSLRENLKLVSAAYERGRASRLDFLTAKLTLANSETDLHNAESSAETALAALNINLGNSVDMAIVQDDSFKEIPSDEKEIMMLDPEKRSAFINTLASESLKNRPELIIKRTTVEQYKHNEGIQSATYLWPSFFVNGKYSKSRYNPESGLTASGVMNEQWTDSWSVAMGATYRWGSVVPWDASNSRKRQQEEKKKQAQYDLDDFVKQITLDVIQNYSSMRAAYSAIVSQKANVMIAEENMKAAQAQFRNGVIDNSKLLEANIQLIKTRSNYIQALVSYSIAKSSLNNIIGREYFNLY